MPKLLTKKTEIYKSLQQYNLLKPKTELDLFSPIKNNKAVKNKSGHYVSKKNELEIISKNNYSHKTRKLSKRLLCDILIITH